MPDTRQTPAALRDGTWRLVLFGAVFVFICVAAALKVFGDIGPVGIRHMPVAWLVFGALMFVWSCVISHHELAATSQPAANEHPPTTEA